jgi:LL-diaminopimelate aminotransferase
MPDKSARLQNLPPFVFAVINQQLRQMKSQGIDVIRLDIGSPDLPPADFVMDELTKSVRNPHHHGYSDYSGIPAFREAVARYYKNRFNVDLNPDTEVLPLIGSKEGIVNLSLAYLDRGDISLIPSIAYPSYEMGARLAGADMCHVEMLTQNGFLLNLDSIPLEVREKAKILWANYPNNPTGAVADLDFYVAMVAFCRENDILFASDNPYGDITFGDYKAPSALQVTGAKDVTIEFMSLSKTYNMAGWRLGAAVGSATALKNLLAIKSNMDSGHFRAIYDAGVAALNNTSSEWIKQRNQIYERRRDKIMAALPEIGLSAEQPLATLYSWAKVEAMDAIEYVNRCRTEAHVSIAPGASYGPGGDGYVRISLSVADERIDEALTRMKKWYQSIQS